MKTTLSKALPAAEFVEHHHRIVGLPPEIVWEGLNRTRWSDLYWSMSFFAVRGLLSPRAVRAREELLLVADGPVRPLYATPPWEFVGARVARPWQRRPERGPYLGDLDAFTAFSEPGWLKYGMDFRLAPLPGGRTRLETSTLCEPTDAVARRKFAPYWRAIRPFSGLIRRDMLRAVAARARRL